MDMNRRKIALSVLALPLYLTMRKAASNGLELDQPSTLTNSIKPYANGNRDATQALQSLIDTSTLRGGATTIPDGTYLINPDVGLRLRSNSKLTLSTNTKLVALASSKGTYAMIRIWNAKDVSVTGGQVIGEREKHNGTTGEWGMGIDIRGSSNISISDISISNCWGDGVYIGKMRSGHTQSTEITLSHINSFNNRRQGLSIVSCAGLRVLNSTFSNTHGTPPQAGIDIEPNGSDIVDNIIIENCICENNSGPGIQTYNHSSNITIRNCRILNNKHPGIMLDGISKNIKLENNAIAGNHGYGIYAGQHVQNIESRGNTIQAPFLSHQSNIKP